MSHKGNWICKCGLKHNISQSDVNNEDFRSCSICKAVPSHKDIIKAKKQIVNKKESSISRQVAKRV